MFPVTFAREPEMIRINVEGRTARSLRNAVRDLDQRLAELLQEVGVSVLSNARLDFETKSRGGSGAGGITWAPLKPQTLANRARRRKGVRNQVNKKSKLTAQIKEAESELKFLGGKGKSVKSKKTKLKKLKQKKRAIRNVLSSVYEKERGQIGVDTGMLRNSAGPGFQGPDGKGGNILEVNQHQVTVGYGRTYAQYFDGGGKGPARPLLPDPLPPEWEADAEQIVLDWIDDVFGPADR